MIAEDEDYQRLSLSFKASGGGLWDYDIDADSLFCDDRWHEILGLDENTPRIESVADFRLHIHPDDVALGTNVDYGKIAELIDKDERYYNEFRIVRPTGEIRWLRSVACLVRDDITHHRRAVGCITDITEFRLEQPDATTTTCDEPTVPDIRPLAITPPEPLQIGPELSDRERECLMWVSMGKTAWETAIILGRSRRTVEFHLRNATSKLGASNKVHAAVTAVRLGLL